MLKEQVAKQGVPEWWGVMGVEGAQQIVPKVAILQQTLVRATAAANQALR